MSIIRVDEFSYLLCFHVCKFMYVIAILIFIVVFGLMGIFAYMILSEKGRRKIAKLVTGMEVTELVTEVSPVIYKRLCGIPVKQTIKIYRCREEGKERYMLEIKSAGGGITTYLKLTDELIGKIVEIADSSGTN